MTSSYLRYLDYTINRSRLLTTNIQGVSFYAPFSHRNMYSKFSDKTMAPSQLI